VNYQVCSIAKFLDKKKRKKNENWWQRHLSKNRKKVNFLGKKKSFSKGHGHGKNHENHVPMPVPVLPENARARAHALFGWFSKSRARALFPQKWACPRALGPCPWPVPLARALSALLPRNKSKRHRVSWGW
jgi:hypothetical protein